MGLGISESFTLFLHIASVAWRKANWLILLYLRDQWSKQLFMCEKLDSRSNQKNREEFKSTYLPLHRPLHAASVQSKSRTEIISDWDWAASSCPLYSAQLIKHIYMIGVFTFCGSHCISPMSWHALILHGHCRQHFLTVTKFLFWEAIASICSVVFKLKCFADYQFYVVAVDNKLLPISSFILAYKKNKPHMKKLNHQGGKCLYD